MYLYLRDSGVKFWSQERPTEDDLGLIEKRLLNVYMNFGGTFVQVDVTGGKMLFADISVGKRVKNIKTGDVYTFNDEGAMGLVESGLWEDVPPPPLVWPVIKRPS